MTQLSFDGFSSSSSPELEPSWYQGRVLSHSSISLYQTCPQKWKFRYIDKVPEKPKSFFSFGKSVHASLEFLFEKKTEIPGLTEVLSHYKSNWLSEGYETPEQERWYFLEGERILKGFYAKHQSEFGRILEIEFKFTVQIGGVPITGFIDRIDRAPHGGLALMDYKTGKAFDKSRVKADPQLTLYQMAARQLLGKPVETVTLYHLNSLTPLTVPAHSSKSEEALVSMIVTVGQGITNQKFEARVDEKGHCQWCDYQQICPAFSSKKKNRTASPIEEKQIKDQIDLYAKLQSKLDDYTKERDRIKSELIQYMDRWGINKMEGNQFDVEKDISNGTLTIQNKKQPSES